MVTRTSNAGALTYAASYEAFGKRTQETGTNPDRQRANTKDEDPTGLLNEGFRYRDIETGMFISRDPAGFVDGPNVYTYVTQNPWSGFDPDGLAERDLSVKKAMEDGKLDLKETARIKWENGEAERFLELSNQKLATNEETRSQIVYKDYKGRELIHSWAAAASKDRALGMSIDDVVVAQTARKNRTKANWELWRVAGNPEDKQRVQIMYALYEIASVSSLPMGLANPNHASKILAQGGGRTITNYSRVGAIGIDDIVKDPRLIGGRSPAEVMKMLDDAGLRFSTRPTTGTVKTGTVIEVQSGGAGGIVQQLRYHPGGGRHQGSYWTLSGSKPLVPGGAGKTQIVGPRYTFQQGQKATTIQGHYHSD